MMIHKVGTVALVVLALAACGKKDKDKDKTEAAGGGAAASGKVVASCDQRAMAGAPIASCIEYRGSAWTAKEIQARCAMEGQVFLTGACPTDGVVLSCVQEKGAPMEAVNRYYDKKERADKICATIGTPL